MPTNTQILLDHRPTDKVSPANFRILEAPVPAPGPREALVRHSFLSLDPYMRGRLSDAKSYAKSQEVGAVMGGGTVGVVQASNNLGFNAGDSVAGGGGWQRYSLCDGRDVRSSTRSRFRSKPISARLACPASPPGMGSTACSRTSAANHSSRRCDDSTIFPRVAVCGLIASYEGAPTALPDMRIFRQAVQDERLHRLRPSSPLAEGDRRTRRSRRAKKLTWRETIRDGLENAPQALTC
jgi:NADPH-dependent curcumin reductase CurA